MCARAAAPAAAATKEKQPDILPHVPVALEATLTVSELRARLLSYGLSTAGLKAELRTRLENAMQTDRLKFQSWDPEALSVFVEGAPSRRHAVPRAAQRRHPVRAPVARRRTRSSIPAPPRAQAAR